MGEGSGSQSQSSSCMQSGSMGWWMVTAAAVCKLPPPLLWDWPLFPPLLLWDQPPLLSEVPDFRELWIFDIRIYEVILYIMIIFQVSVLYIRLSIGSCFLYNLKEIKI